MKNFCRLLQNELTKLWKQLAYRILLFVLIGLSLLSPLLGYLDTVNFDYRSAKDVYENYMGMSEANDGVWREFYIALAEAQNFFIENKIDNTWKYNYFQFDYQNAYIRAVGARLVESGKITPEEYDKEPFSRYIYVFEDAPMTDDGDTKEDPDEPRLRTYAEAKAALDTMADEILKKTKRDVAFDYMEYEADSMASLNLMLAEYEAEFEKKPDNFTLKYNIEILQMQIKHQEMMIEVYRTIGENDATPFGWQYAMADELRSVAYSKSSTVPMPRETYIGDYDAHFAECERLAAYYDEVIEVYIHSINTNNCFSPVSDSSLLYSFFGGTTLLNSSAKTQLRTALTAFINLFTILMVVMSAGIISNEFSSGTIRLLLIRPRSRRQIIASKLTAVGLIYFFVTAFMSLILTAVVTMVFGVGDLFAPDIVYMSGRIVELPPIVLTLQRIGIATLSALAYIAFAMLLAALTRKNSLSIILPMLVYTFGSTASMFVSSMAGSSPEKLGWLTRTPAVYFNISGILPPPHEYMNMMQIYTYNGVELWLGVVYHAVFILAATYLTVLAFRKKQVKS